MVGTEPENFDMAVNKFDLIVVLKVWGLMG